MVVLSRVCHAEISKADEIRLAYLLNFSRYVTWQASTERSGFNFCIAENEVLLQRLKSAVEGKQIEGRQSHALLVTDVENVKQCDVLYLPQSNKSQYEEKYLIALSQSPVLTVGDNENFLNKGGSVRFIVIEGTVRFEIHLDHVRAAGLDMSSRLLKHAERVVEQNKNSKKGEP
jgi:hypothetical protein